VVRSDIFSVTLQIKKRDRESQSKLPEVTEVVKRCEEGPPDMIISSTGRVT
jgi:hypothetical protein